MNTHRVVVNLDCPFSDSSFWAYIQTVTLVEAILQILARDPDAHILACTPSNQSADLLASRLANSGLTREQLFRLVLTPPLLFFMDAS